MRTPESAQEAGKPVAHGAVADRCSRVVSQVHSEVISGWSLKEL
jgi:hypothetical protein